MFVDIADTTVPNLIYVEKIKCLLPNGVDEFYWLFSSSQYFSFRCWDNLVIAPADCSQVLLSSHGLWYDFGLWSQQVDITRGEDDNTRCQASREPHNVTSAQLSIVVWKMSASSEERFVGVSESESDTYISVIFLIVVIWIYP